MEVLFRSCKDAEEEAYVYKHLCDSAYGFLKFSRKPMSVSVILLTCLVIFGPIDVMTHRFLRRSGR